MPDEGCRLRRADRFPGILCSMTTLLSIAGLVSVSLLVGAGVLHLLPRLGKPGRGLSEVLCRGFGLDLMITYFTIAPMVVGFVVGCWPGLLAAIGGQVIGLLIWTRLHELAHPAARKGPRIVHALNRSVGRVRNHAALWVTALAVPLFWVVRIGEWVIYPPLTWIIRLPPYKSAEWVNVSRYKFDGLVGHDLIWCLYCDWMTGVWSLGTEMLRNVESFWCPIRFYSGKKCENCTIDFPDIDNGWVDADGTMGDVVKVLQEKHKDGDHSWFGHPRRVTVEGKPQVSDTDKQDTDQA
jgi:hypothetical protein